MADEPPSKRARSEATGQELPAAFSAALGRALDGAAPGEAFRGAAPWPHMQVRTQVPQSAVGAKSARPGGEGALRGAARRGSRHAHRFWRGGCFTLHRCPPRAGLTLVRWWGRRGSVTRARVHRVERGGENEGSTARLVGVLARRKCGGGSASLRCALLLSLRSRRSGAAPAALAGRSADDARGR